MFACAECHEPFMASILSQLRGISAENAEFHRQQLELSRQHALTSSALTQRVIYLENMIAQYAPDMAAKAGVDQDARPTAIECDPLASVYNFECDGVRGSHVRFQGVSPQPRASHMHTTASGHADHEWKCPVCFKVLCNQESFKSHVYKLLNSSRRRRPVCRLQARIPHHRSNVASFPGSNFDAQKESFATEFYEVVRSSCTKSNDQTQAHKEVFDWLRVKFPEANPMATVTANDYALSSSSQSRSSAQSSTSQSSGSEPPWSSHSNRNSPSEFFSFGDAPS